MNVPAYLGPFPAPYHIAAVAPSARAAPPPVAARVVRIDHLIIIVLSLFCLVHCWHLRARII